MAKSLNGVKVPHYKNTQGNATEVIPVPNVVRIVMSQHIGAPCEPQVKKGDTVKVGQLIGDSDQFISAPIHASVSGTVTGIESTTMPNGSRAQTVVIESDKEQTIHESVVPPVITDHDSFIAALRNSGIVGLGGAGFPTHVKLNPKNQKDVHTLLVNAAECEPYITSDHRTIIEQADDLFHGVQMAMKYLNLDKCVIAVEDNKPDAITKLTEMASTQSNISVFVLPSLYPQGAEKILIYQALDGLTVPEGKLPADIGVIVSNVTTMAEIGRYVVDGMPLITKRITVDGGAVTTAKNIRVPIGTPIKDVIEFCGGYRGTPSKILLGGPMMGLAVESDEFPILKNNNAILAFDRSETTRYEETPCIKCGRCVRACPMNLMPAAMKNATMHEDVDRLKNLKANLCMECGCCAYVCPARQELVQSHRKAKVLMSEAAKASK